MISFISVFVWAFRSGTPYCLTCCFLCLATAMTYLVPKLSLCLLSMDRAIRNALKEDVILSFLTVLVQSLKQNPHEFLLL